MARRHPTTRTEQFGPARARGAGPGFLLDPLLSRRTELVLRELAGCQLKPNSFAQSIKPSYKVWSIAEAITAWP